MVVAKELIQLPCLQKWDKVRLKSPTMLVYTPPASSLLTYLFWFAFLYFNWSSLLIHFNKTKKQTGKMREFLSKKAKIENWKSCWHSTNLTEKKKNMQKRESEFTRNFLKLSLFWKKRLKNSETNLVKLLVKKRRGQAASSLFGITLTLLFATYFLDLFLSSRT